MGTVFQLRSFRQSQQERPLRQQRHHFCRNLQGRNQQTSNRIDALPGFTPSYDSDGNLLNDGIHTYAWNSNGQPTAVDGVGLTYDALGHLIEINRNGTIREVAYAHGGAKLALMSGQSVQTA